MAGRQGGWISSAAMVLGMCLHAGAHAGETAVPAPSGGLSAAEAGARLVAAYPDALSGVDGSDLLWKDGTRMPLDDGKGGKAPEALLAGPDLQDMFAMPYVASDPPTPPARDEDPGRARPAAFFDKMYGNCRNGGVKEHLDTIVWLPRKSGSALPITRLNGVAEKLSAVSAELDELPVEFDRFLAPPGGTYVCRAIAGTDRVSAHGYGIAIDIAVKPSHYWRWSKPAPDGSYPWQNAIPMEIVRIFERHGFIWGGRWSHFDTMHFEYRPELLPASKP